MIPAWSYSSLTKFETCPQQYYRVRVTKEFQDSPSEATRWGSEVHKHIENRIRDNTPMPEGFETYEKYAARIVGEEVLVEQQLAITKDFKPTGWFDKDAWCRGIIDAAVRNGDSMTALDWKTGARKPDSTQLKLFAGLIFSHYPVVETVKTGFLWLKEGKVDTEKFTRVDIPEIWKEFLPRVRRLELAYEKDNWPVKTSGLCNGWCPVRSCTFWKEGKKK